MTKSVVLCLILLLCFDGIRASIECVRQSDLQNPVFGHLREVLIDLSESNQVDLPLLVLFVSCLFACSRVKRWTTTHVTATHTRGKASNTNAVPDNCPAKNFSLIQDPSVWSTAAAGGYPSMPDTRFGICAVIDALLVPGLLVVSLGAGLCQYPTPPGLDANC